MLRVQGNVLEKTGSDNPDGNYEFDLALPAGPSPRG